MKKYKLFLETICFTLFFISGVLNSTPIVEDKLKVESGKMLFTLVKLVGSGYDKEMVNDESMTGLAEQIYGKMNLKENTFDVSIDVNPKNFFVGGKFKFANPKMHDSHLESFKFGTMNFKGLIDSYDSITGIAKVTGTMTAHAVSINNFKMEGKVTSKKNGNGYLLASDFAINLHDFKIKMPDTKLTKINSIVKVKMKLELVGMK